MTTREMPLLPSTSVDDMHGPIPVFTGPDRPSGCFFWGLVLALPLWAAIIGGAYFLVAS